MLRFSKRLAVMIGVLALAGLLVARSTTLLAAPPAQTVPVVAVTPFLGNFTNSRQGSAVNQIIITPTISITDTTATPVPTLAIPTGSDVSETDTTEWGLPINLSRSGSTANPQIVIDSSGRFHALWRDTIDGFGYALGDGLAWSDPVGIEAPFATRRTFPDLEPEDPTPYFTPQLVADSVGNIHAFWIDTSEPAQRTLYHSQVSAGQFNNINAWSPRQLLDTGSLLPTTLADASGRIHLAYVRNQENSGRRAGIYYLVVRPNGAGAEPRAIYLSRYLRSSDATSANVTMATAGDQEMTIAWDDGGREQVFVARSLDGGQTWSEPVEIDRRAAEDSRDAAGPSRITVGAMPGSTIVTWGAGHEPGRTCSQYYRTYSAADNTWSVPQPMDELPDCLATAQFLLNGQTLFLLGTTSDATAQPGSIADVTTYLMAWNGANWGLTEPQTALADFANPDTNQPLALGCQQGQLADRRLVLVGCDRGVGGDSWAFSRALGDPTAWFPPPPIWQGPDRVVTSETELRTLEIVTDAAGQTHAFWHDGESSEIYHMRWDGQTWSSAFPVVNGLQGPVEQITVASWADRLYLVGRDRQGLFFSEASSARPTEWSAPSPLPAISAAAVAPDLLADNSGLTLTYAVPLNEQRGVFLTTSIDRGRTWSEPRLAFDGTAAGWDMVDHPQVTKTEGGVIHLVWLRRSLPPEAAPLGLTYSRSADGGFTWSEPQEVVKTPVAWNRLFGVGDRVLHRLWAEPSNGRHVIWHAISIDAGLTWGENTQVTALDEGELPAAAVDPVGRLHLLAINDGRLLNWVWNGAAWTSDEGLRTTLADGGLLGVGADTAGRLMAVYAGRIPGTTAEAVGSDLLAMWRSLALPAEDLPVPPTLTPTPPPTATPQPAPTIQPTPTITFSTAAEGGLLSQIPGANSQAGQLAIAIIPAALVVLLVSVIGFRAMRMGRK